MKTMRIRAEYPTPRHEEASKAIVDHFSQCTYVEAVILYGSCARGRAAEDSCLDIMILVPQKLLSTDKLSLERQWNEFYQTDKVFKELLQAGKYSHVDLDFIDGCFTPGHHGWTTGPDEFELEIGNTLLYGVPLWQCGERLESLRSEWLPYYNEELRSKRLAMVKAYCQNNLDHIPGFIKRGLYFQSFDRLYNAFQEFIQALFISRRTYPIAYDKWVKEQFEEILELPDLYGQLARILQIEELESDGIREKAIELRSLFDRYVQE